MVNLKEWQHLLLAFDHWQGGQRAFPQWQAHFYPWGRITGLWFPPGTRSAKSLVLVLPPYLCLLVPPGWAGWCLSFPDTPALPAPLLPSCPPQFPIPGENPSLFRAGNWDLQSQQRVLILRLVLGPLWILSKCLLMTLSLVESHWRALLSSLQRAKPNGIQINNLGARGLGWIRVADWAFKSVNKGWNSFMVTSNCQLILYHVIMLFKELCWE